LDKTHKVKADKDKLRTNAKLGSACIAPLPTCRALQAFFRRAKRGETPGYPRFKSASRFAVAIVAWSSSATITPH
jgi:hypothetical protein